MKIDIEQEFLDIVVLTTQQNLIDYFDSFSFDSLDHFDSELAELRCRLSEKRDFLFDDWVKKRTPQVRFSEIKSSSNEIIPEIRHHEW